MNAKVFSFSLIGIEAALVEVEVDIGPGLHIFNIVGLPNKTVEEAKDRISSAIKNSGFSPPQRSNRRVVVNLAPADLKKQGSVYDLPMAISYLLASKQMASFDTKDFLFLGELSLDGRVRRVPGVLPATLLAQKMSIGTIIVPKENENEAAIIAGLNIIGVQSLVEVIDFFEGRQKIMPTPYLDFSQLLKIPLMTGGIADIHGQYQAKRAMMIAAAGGHNILMSGPPGSGKTMLAKALPTILPELSLTEALEVAQIYSVCGLLHADKPLISARPFRAPHHTASSVSLVGGGAWPRPGEISLAHRGVLFLDEMAEFPRIVLEGLRQPLEDGEIAVTRAQGRVSFPAKFILVAAMNPCPCGFLGDREKQCQCSQKEVLNYRKKISGPLLDRLDIQIDVPRLKFEELKKQGNEEKEKKNFLAMKKMISQARAIQKKRFVSFTRPIFYNGEMNSPEVEKFCQLDSTGEELLKKAVDGWGLSARAHYRILKLSRTIADLEESLNISASHLAEAIRYRMRQEE